MTDTARVLLTAAVLSASAMSVFAWRLTRADSTSAERLVGQLRLAQLAALLLAVAGGVSIGQAIAIEAVPAAGSLDVTLGVVFVVVAGVVLRREPREALWIAAAGLLLRALADVAHRPGWLPPDLTPRSYVIGSAVYEVYLAALCYWARRR